ncbi:MAG: hypothetical protein F6K47_31090 [Symploca sp. SIO2E6]|nr:hypothetical protein [Symploca sp. SIO2E6]
MAQKVSALRAVYQYAYGRQVSDRTWQRVKSRLKINDEDDEVLLPVVNAYGRLRRLNPNRSVTRSNVSLYLSILDNMPQFQCSGEDLLEVLQRLEPQPSLATIYRWGHEIGCPFHKKAQYSDTDLKKWITKIIEQTKFKFPNNKMRRVG